MNLSTYLAQTAMQNTEAQGRTERLKQEMATRLANAESAAKGRAIGAAIGSGLGALRGGFDAYSGQQESADAEQGFKSRQDFSDISGNTAAEGKENFTQDVGKATPGVQASLDRNMGIRSEAAAAVGYQPRQSTVNPLIDTRPEVTAPSGVLARPAGMKAGVVADVSNDPLVDWKKLDSEAAQRLLQSGYLFRNLSRSRY